VVLKALLAQTRGGVSALSAVLIVALIGGSALATEYGHGLLMDAENQRVADLAAYSGAVIYNATSSNSALTAAVNNVVALNGLTASTATPSVVTSPSGSGNQAVKVVVTTSSPLFLARVITSATTLPVSAVAFAEMSGGAPGCIIALNHAGTGVTLTGGTSISAPGCTVVSNNTVSVHCGDTITTPTIDYNSSTAPNQSCNPFLPPPGHTSVAVRKIPATDPLAGNSSVSAAEAHLPAVIALTSPATPTVPTSGHNITFNFSVATTQAAIAADGCSGSFASSTWTVTCSGNGPFNFGTISLQGGITVNFSVSGSPSATYNFNGMIDFSSGTALNFGPGKFNIKQGIVTGGGSTMSFGAGTFNIGPLPSGKCSVNGESICDKGTSLTFGGPSTFVLSGGISVPGGYTLTMGSGSTNSFTIGADNNGDSLNGGGGSKITFADATGGGDLFQMAGNLNDGGGGGSCITVSAAANHDINGFFTVAGGITLGAGIYTVDDYVGIGVSNGGDVTCNGVSVGVNAVGVTFVIGGNATVTCADGSNQVFCIGAGYAHVTVTAPTSGTMEGLAVIGPNSGTGGADLSNGASNTTVSGAFYFPNGPITMSGAATLGNGSSNCLEMIGSQISLSGGSAVGTTCTLASGSGGGTPLSVVLVQ